MDCTDEETGGGPNGIELKPWADVIMCQSGVVKDHNDGQQQPTFPPIRP